MMGAGYEAEIAKLSLQPENSTFLKINIRSSKQMSSREEFTSGDTYYRCQSPIEILLESDVWLSYYGYYLYYWIVKFLASNSHA